MEIGPTVLITVSAIIVVLGILASLFAWEQRKTQKALPKKSEEPVGSTYFADPPATMKKD